MSVVPGKELMDMRSDTKIGNTTAGDAYWAARANLHRMGIAHNDMHPGNLLIDETGKGRWVDMGLANDSPGAALAEALGVLRRPRGSVGVGRGDWQGQGYGPETGNRVGFVAPTAPENLRKMKSNHETKVLPFLRSKGLTDDEIGTVMTYGIRQDPSSYTTTSGFNKLNDSDALQAINLLYDEI
jgi:serine/threonine protein kinase